MFPLSLAANNRTSETVKHEPRSGKGKTSVGHPQQAHTGECSPTREEKKIFVCPGSREGMENTWEKNAIANVTFP